MPTDLAVCLIGAALLAGFLGGLVLGMWEGEQCAKREADHAD